MEARVAVILLNWNGWRDTLECIESLLSSDYDNFQIIVCDNASTDGSVSKIEGWLTDNNIQYAKTQAVRINSVESQDSFSEKVLLIENEKNGGFAYGNNVGLKYVCAKSDVKFVWVLNNDTVVPVNSLRLLLEKMDENPQIGICGSKVVYFHDRNVVQALGGAKYSKWLGRSIHLGAGMDSSAKVDVASIEKAMSYVLGASMFVRREYLERIGLMSEDYFLYYEEIDWATRGRGKFSLGYCDSSVVYHKEGGSIGSSRIKKRRSSLSQFYLIRSRLIFSEKFHCAFLLLVWGFSFLQGVREYISGNPEIAKQTLRALFGAKSYKA